MADLQALNELIVWLLLRVVGMNQVRRGIQRKGHASVQLQAVCISDIMFLEVYTGCLGTVHDAWELPIIWPLPGCNGK